MNLCRSASCGNSDFVKNAFPPTFFIKPVANDYAICHKVFVAGMIRPTRGVQTCSRHPEIAGSGSRAAATASRVQRARLTATTEMMQTPPKRAGLPAGPSITAVIVVGFQEPPRSSPASCADPFGHPATAGIPNRSTNTRGKPIWLWNIATQETITLTSIGIVMVSTTKTITGFAATALPKWRKTNER